jgi:nucleoside-diphosphate-sugar epimerase
LIAVTGATGFIGQRLCLALRQRGHPVRALVRTAPKAQALMAAGVEITLGDLSDSTAIGQLVSDCTAVFHCAGSVRGRTLEDFYPVNVTGVTNLLAAASHANPQVKILLLSSLAARQPSLSHYANSKHLGEQAAIASQTQASFSILRPPAIYGPGDKELLPLFQLMQKGVALIPGLPSDRASLLYVDDLVAAMLAWLALDNAPKETFTLCDGAENGYSWAEIAALASQLFQREVRVAPLPRRLLDGIAAINQAAAKLLGYAPMLTPAKLRELRHPDWRCDNRAFCQATGWQPQTDFFQGLRLTLANTAKPSKNQPTS